MTQPTSYAPSTQFTDHSNANPNTPHSGTNLDTEFTSLQTTLNDILQNLVVIQRDDTKLANASVHPDAFTADSLLLMGGNWTPKGPWVTATNYAIGDAVNETDILYVCAEAHTSGTFITDLTAGKWVKLTLAAKDVPFTPAGSIAATEVQAAIEELDADVTLKASASDLAAHEAADLTAHGASAFGDSLASAADAAAVRALIGALTNPLTAKGQIIVADTGGAITVFGPGTDGNVLGYDAGTVTSFALPTPRGYLAGLSLTNNAIDLAHDIDISPGVARDSLDVDSIKLAATLTKQIDAAWAVGTNQGGLDAGAVQASTTYHVWLIKRSDTGVVDVLFSTSVSTPTMPADYDRKRRIGSVITGGSSNIIRFTHDGDYFWWDTPIVDVNVTGTGVTRVSRSMTVPLGLKIKGIFGIFLSGGVNQGNQIVLTDPDAADLDPATFSHCAHAGLAGESSLAASGTVLVATDTSSQIGTRATDTSGSLTVKVATSGYIDTRGRDD